MEVDSQTAAGKRGREPSISNDANEGNSSQSTNRKKKIKEKPNEITCTVCCLMVAESEHLLCAICSMPYHASCCGWGFTPSPTEMKLLSITGWACTVCVTGAKAAFDKLQVCQTSTSKRLLELHARLELLESKMEKCNALSTKDGPGSSRSVDGSTAGAASRIGAAEILVNGREAATVAPQGGAGDLAGVNADVDDGTWMMQRRGGFARQPTGSARDPAVTAASLNLAAFVERTVTNINRKRMNLAVSGLKETGTDKGDAELFSRLCSHFLNYTPHVVKSARVGKASSDTNVRLQIITLNSADEVDYLLRVAKNLRDADEDYVSRRVFINRDITKEESKALYDKRVARRTRALAAEAASAAAVSVGASQQNLNAANCWSNTQTNTDSITRLFGAVEDRGVVPTAVVDKGVADKEAVVGSAVVGSAVVGNGVSGGTAGSSSSDSVAGSARTCDQTSPLAGVAVFAGGNHLNCAVDVA